MSLVGLQDAIVASIDTGLSSSFRAVQAHGGRFDEDELKRIATKQPACLVTVMGGAIARHGGSQGVCSADVLAFVVTAGSSTTARSRAAMDLAEDVGQLAVDNAWSYSDAKAPENIRAENLYSGALDRLGVAMWLVRWQQQTDFTEYDITQLDQFHTFSGKFDLDPRDGVINIEALVYLHESQFMGSVAYEYISSAASTNLTADTYAKAAGTTTLGYSSADVSMPSSNRLQYDSGPTKAFSVSATAAPILAQLLGGPSDAEVTLAFAVNGVVDTTTEAPVFLDKTKDPAEVSISGVLKLDAGDYVEVWVKCSETTEVKLEKLSVVMAAV